MILPQSVDLFDAVERTDKGPMRYSEDRFGYYNRSARPPVGRIRSLLQRWFDRYPGPHQAELRTRFRTDFDAAFYELFMHELVLRLGYTTEVHPVIDPGATRRPDFLVRSDSGYQFLLECTLARDESEEEEGRRKVQEVLLDSINQLQSTNFMLDVDIHRVTTEAPSGRAIKEFLARELASLDPDELSRRYASEGGWEALPELVYATDKVHLVFRPIPVRPDRRGKIERPIGMLGPVEMVEINPMLAVRRTVKKKATAYGDVRMPYVLAVNAVAEHGPHRTDFIEALFGDVNLRVSRHASGRGSDSRWVRSPNGIWLGPTGPRHTRLSAVLFAVPATPWNLPHVPTLLIRNPWARHPDNSALACLPQAVISEENLAWKEGTSTGDIFGLEDGWPHPERDDPP